MKSTLAVISLFTTAVLAQSTSSGASNPLIPNDISPGCQSFLQAFDADPTLTACTQSLVNATQKYGANGSSSPPSKADVTATIDSICNGSASNACPPSLVRSELAKFYANCSDELTSKPNDQVRALYDMVYMAVPLQQALCAKDDSKNYCALSTTGAPSTGDINTIQKNLAYTPASSDTPTANLTTFNANYLPYLMRNPNMETGALCTTCTRNILLPYFTFQSDCPYAAGLSNSPSMNNQQKLLNTINSQCGANFLNGAVQAAGGISSNGPLDSGASQTVGRGNIAAILAGGLTVAISSLL